MAKAKSKATKGRVQQVVDAVNSGQVTVTKFPDAVIAQGARDEFGRLRKIEGLPQFLRDAALQHPPITDEQIKRMASPAGRVWTAIKKKGEWAERPTMPIKVTDESLPVKVQVKKGGEAGSTLLAEYPDMATFRANHDLKTYPASGPAVTFEGFTVILVTAKPWAGKVKVIDPNKPKKVPGALGEKAQKIADMLQRAEGTTTKEVLEVTGWPAVSMPAQAKIAGLHLRKDKIDGVTRYWGSK